MQNRLFYLSFFVVVIYSVSTNCLDPFDNEKISAAITTQIEQPAQLPEIVTQALYTAADLEQALNTFDISLLQRIKNSNPELIKDALFGAVRNNRGQLIKFIIDNAGIDIAFIKDEQNRSILDIAIDQNNFGLAQQLLNADLRGDLLRSISREKIINFVTSAIAAQRGDIVQRLAPFIGQQQLYAIALNAINSNPALITFLQQNINVPKNALLANVVQSIIANNNVNLLPAVVSLLQQGASLQSIDPALITKLLQIAMQSKRQDLVGYIQQYLGSQAQKAGGALYEKGLDWLGRRKFPGRL